MNLAKLLLDTADTAADTSSAVQNGGTGGTLFMVIYIVIIVAAMYFLLIRPQKKKQKKEKELLENIQMGDEIVTIGGFYGRIVSVKDDTVVIESLVDHSKQRILKSAISQNLTIHDDTPSK